ncbi:MAG: trypsin-like peptidase domain-containing protein [Phycisphaerae bacterium]
MRNRPYSQLGVLLGVLAALVVVATGIPDRVLTHIAYATQRGRLQAATEELSRLEEISHAFRLVADVARPAVVQIQVRGVEADRQAFEELEQQRGALREQLEELEKRGRADDDGGGEELLNLMRKLRELEEQRERLIERMHQASGSGIVLDEQGHILTNNHVVEGRSDIQVTLHDEREFPAQLVGADPKSDLAVLKIDAADLHTLPFADSDRAEVGDWVLAVGAPFGLAHTVTHGIISAKGRNRIDAPGREIVYQDFIQTDAAINPGNSGGPLMNLRGEVVGVNTAIATNGGSYNAGVAFTIPSNMARKIARQLVDAGRVTRGWLGVQLAELALEDALVFGLGDRRGVMVDVVYRGAAADKAGVLCEDIIVAANGTPVPSIEKLRAVIADAMPGEVVRLELVRDGETRRIELPVDPQPDDITSWIRAAEAVRTCKADRLDLELRSLRSQESKFLAQNWGMAPVRGVFVWPAERESPKDAPISGGEIVVAVDGREVRSVREFNDAVRTAGNKDRIALVVLNSEGQRRTVELTP